MLRPPREKGRGERPSVLAGFAEDELAGFKKTTALGEALGGESERWLNHSIDSAVASSRNLLRPAEALRERGTELLERSRDVWSAETRHPAYDRILDDLAPDEARILVMLLQNGPQPTVDVRTGGPLSAVSSQLVARGLNMLGVEPGCHCPDLIGGPACPAGAR